MKIQHISLKNFSSHADSTLAFEKPIALIVGQLNAGKSSIQQAIEYALTGAAGMHTKKTDNKSEFVRGAGAHGQMSIHLTTDAGSAVRVRDAKENTESLSWNDMPQSSGATMDAVVAAATKVTKTVLSAIMNTSNFFNLEDAEQRTIILGLIGAEITDAKVRKAWEGEAAALALLPSKIDSMRALDTTYKYCFDRRTVAKRDLDALRPPAPPEGEEPNIQKIKERLATLEASLELNVREKAKLEGAASAGAGKEVLKAERTRIDTELAHPVPDLAAMEKQFQDEREHLQEATNTCRLLENEVVDLRVKVASAEKNIGLLKDFNGVCVAGPHACPAPMKDMQAAKKTQEGFLAEYKVALEDAQKRLSNVKTVRDNRGRLTELEHALSAVKATPAHRAKLEARIKEIDAELKKEVPTIETAGIAKLAADITELRERISKGKTILDNAAAWAERKRQVAEVAERRKKGETEVRYLEGLCEFLGPKGIRVALIDEKIATFIATIDGYLKPFGFSMALDVENWHMSINGQPIKRLSASERYRLSVAFQVGIAKMSGLNFVICDGSEILTPPVFSQMIGMLNAAGLDQAIVVKTLMIPTEKFVAERPKMPFLEYFVITNDAGVSTVERLD